MSTPAMRRYAAEIYRLQQDHQQVTLSMLEGEMETSLQAISRMVRRLKEQDYLIHEPYRGMRLTETGEGIAMPSLRRHRLVENFLVKVMGYDWAAAHVLADTFELGINDELEDRLDELTGFPTRCPHGEPIPSKEGVMPEMNDANLVTLEPGAKGRISRVRTHDMEKLAYIGELGLVPGVEFEYLNSAPFNGPVRIKTGAQEHVLGYELAARLWVEVGETTEK